MCASSDAEIEKNKVYLYMGYYGGNIKIGNVNYKQNGTEESRLQLIEKLKEFKKHDIAVLIADLIDNSNE